MKIALLADIHGNLTALNKVLEDARRRGADEYILAGDYCISGPHPDECVSIIRGLKNAHVIMGNEEQRFEGLAGSDRINRTDGQMQITYWCCRNIGKENMRYLLELPQRLELVRNGVPIRVAHSVSSFIGTYGSDKWSSAVLKQRYRGRKMTPEIIARDVFTEVAADPDFQSRVSGLTDGVCVFSHSHIQWDLKADGRNVWLINPGSCGLPLDGLTDSIPYTMLTVSATGEVGAEQIRLPFDKEAYVTTLKATSQYREARIWSEVIIRELLETRENVIFFLRFAERYAQSIGDTERPFSARTWENAYKEWERSSFADGAT